jgi:phosphate/sulfate permease
MPKRVQVKKSLLTTYYQFLEFIKAERVFLIIIALCFFAAGSSFQYAHIAMWLGFMFAAYSAVANDSIQTIGTFLSSNSHQKWYVLWLFIGGIFLVTVTYSWFTYSGDVSYQRLATPALAEAPTEFTFLQIAAPVFLLIITRLRMPVSTTFLILSCFSADLNGIIDMLSKSMLGYITAFTVGIGVWAAVSRWISTHFTGEAKPYWRPLQWVTSGCLWSVWVMQDIANVAVYLPRSLGTYQFLGFAAFIFAGLGILFYLRGDKIQEIVTEKSHTYDVRSATIIDFIYAILLFFFKELSNIPMSTTWVFIGLLAGRELAMSIMDQDGFGQSYKRTFKLIRRDILYAAIGLLVSIALAVAINPEINREIMEILGLK